MLMKIAGRVRGLFAGNYPENREDEQFHLNSRGDQIVSQGLPELTEIVRLGESWQVMLSTAQVPITTLPLTIPALSLWNGEPAGGKTYVIDSVFATEIVVDLTQSDMTAIFVCNNKPPVTAPTDLAHVVRSLSGRTYGGKARTTHSSNAITNEGWFPVGTSAPVAAVVAGSAWKNTDVKVNGMYLVPPGGMFSISAAKVSAIPAQLLVGVRWHEAQLIVKS